MGWNVSGIGCGVDSCVFPFGDHCTVTVAGSANTVTREPVPTLRTVGEAVRLVQAPTYQPQEP